MFRYIALCGAPKTGKSEVQRIIARRYGYIAIDDSLPLRQATQALYGLSSWHVSTQEGKSSLVPVGGAEKTVRKLMGDLGTFLEERDPYYFPRQAVMRAERAHPGGRFVFASVRGAQPVFFKQTGTALVIEVVRRGCKIVHDFDRYDRKPVRLTIENHLDQDRPAASLMALEDRVSAALDPFLMRAHA
jgi:hypothetical protein